MRIGITCDLKTDLPPGIDQPDDFQEEFDSPVTAESIATVLRNLGHTVEFLGNGQPMLKRLLADPPDFVFNIAEGHGSERSREARVPAVLEMLNIPCTGSDPLTLAATLDKDCARRLVQSHGIKIPCGVVCEPGEVLTNETIHARLSAPPWIIKPAREGSSKGIRGKCVVDTLEEANTVTRRLHRDYKQPVLVEDFIAGDELTVGMIDNDPPRIIAVMRVTPRQSTDRFVYSLEVKRDYLQQVQYQCPAQLPPDQLAAVERAALTTYRVLGCRDVARIDFRMREGVPYFLEVNPLPGLNPESSDLVIMARMAGWSYDQLIGGIFQAALVRQGKI